MNFSATPTLSSPTFSIHFWIDYSAHFGGKPKALIPYLSTNGRQFPTCACCQVSALWRMRSVTSFIPEPRKVILAIFPSPKLIASTSRVELIRYNSTRHLGPKSLEPTTGMS